MRAVWTMGPTRRAFALSLALALALAAVPLQRLSAAAHDPVRSGAGMGTRVPLMFETGARLVAPGTAAGTVRLPAVPRRSTGALPAALTWLGVASGLAGGPGGTLLLTAYGRLQLEGG